MVDEYPDSMLVAEAWVDTWDRLALYIRADEYHQAFDFELAEAPWDPETMREDIDRALAGAGAVGSIPTWVLSNHDLVRETTRYGLPQDLDARDWLLEGERSLLDHDLGLRRARAAALLILGLPGSAYLYQGEELGLPEVHDLPVEVLDDPTWERSRHTRKGRDGCRVPIPWRLTGESFGFGSNGSWLPQPGDWGAVSVEAQDGMPGSNLELYRAAIRLRSDLMVGDESFQWVELKGCLSFRRDSVLVVVNFGPDPAPLTDGEILISSVPLDSGPLPPDAAAWIALE